MQRTNVDCFARGDTESRINFAGCPFCGGTRLDRVYQNLYNKRKPDFGPFDFYQCDECGSGLTWPLPSPEDLAALYQVLELGLSPLTRELLADYPDAAWHQMCLDHIAALFQRDMNEGFTWVDVGAGAGEMAAALALRFPASRGVAIDIHDRPPALARSANVQWMKIEIDNDEFARSLGVKADLVFAVGVWEHVRHPDAFVRNSMAMMGPRSMLYLITPNYGSWARRLLGRRWPYFFPGEHICIPSLAGARRSLDREFAKVRGAEARSRTLVRPVMVSFSLRYVWAKLVTPRAAKLFPRSVVCKLPSGALEAVLWLDT
jgi:2-polyprenyl-3-methyl-5-hydroxy-6-metoxy-1,4-benzoquinol methylase